MGMGRGQGKNRRNFLEGWEGIMVRRRSAWRKEVRKDDGEGEIVWSRGWQ